MIVVKIKVLGGLYVARGSDVDQASGLHQVKLHNSLKMIWEIEEKFAKAKNLDLGLNKYKIFFHDYNIVN